MQLNKSASEDDLTVLLSLINDDMGSNPLSPRAFWPLKNYSKSGLFSSVLC